MQLWQRLLGAASVRVWHITSRRWGPWTERPLPEVVRVAYPPAQLASYAFKSNDMVVSTYREMSHFRFTATVEPDGPRMYRLTMASDQIDGAGFFAFCIAAYATAKAGYARYVMGTKLPKQKVMTFQRGRPNRRLLSDTCPALRAYARAPKSER